MRSARRDARAEGMRKGHGGGRGERGVGTGEGGGAAGAPCSSIRLGRRRRDRSLVRSDVQPRHGRCAGVVLRRRRGLEGISLRCRGLLGVLSPWVRLLRGASTYLSGVQKNAESLGDVILVRLCAGPDYHLGFPSDSYLGVPSTVFARWRQNGAAAGWAAAPPPPLACIGWH